MRVRTKSTEHEARQYAGTSDEKRAVLQWCDGIHPSYCLHMILETLDGATRVIEDGDWIIQYPAGQYHVNGFKVCNSQEFREVYEEIPGPENNESIYAHMEIPT